MNEPTEQTLRDVFATLTKKQRWAVDILAQVKTKTCKASIKDLKKAKDIIDTMYDDQVMAVQYYLKVLERDMNQEKENQEDGREKSE